MVVVVVALSPHPPLAHWGSSEDASLSDILEQSDMYGRLIPAECAGVPCCLVSGLAESG
jgi:hypothetical protein